MIRQLIVALIILMLVGCGESSYTFDHATWHAADGICSENKGIKTLTVTRHWPPKIENGMLGAIDMVKCNDGAIYYNRSDKRYPVKEVEK